MPPRSRVLVSVLSGLFLIAPPLLFAADTVTLDDVVALLKAGVGESIILKEIGAGGPAFPVGVREVLKLKEAGASDHLIETLLTASRPAGDAAALSGVQEAVRPAAYRIYKEKSADGQEFLHVTNLDPSGRRMGGEVAETQDVPNRYDSSGRESGAAPPADRVPQREYQVIGEAAPPPPVIVNVYPPGPSVASGFGEVYGSPYMYRDPYAYRYPGGILPGYHPYGRFRPPPVWAPPGSWTHFRMFHSENLASPRPRSAPSYTPIGSAIGYDTFYRHTQEAFPR